MLIAQVNMANYTGFVHAGITAATAMFLDTLIAMLKNENSHFLMELLLQV